MTMGIVSLQQYALPQDTHIYWVHQPLLVPYRTRNPRKIFKSKQAANMCYLVDLPERRYESAYLQIVDDLEYRNGEPTEGAPPLPEFMEYNTPMADASRDVLDYRFAQDLESLWPAREGHWPETEEEGEERSRNWLIRHLERHFDKAVREWARNDSEWARNDDYSPQYDDYFLRRFLHHLPRKMDFDSWVGQALIYHVTWKYELPFHKIHVSEDKKTLTYHVGDYWPHKGAKILVDIAEELDAIPTFLFDLALEYAVWLPYEMQLISGVVNEDHRRRYRRGRYSGAPQLLRPYDENGCGHFYLNCQMHARRVLGYDWFELPINTSYGLHW